MRAIVGRSHFWILTLALYSVVSAQVQKLDLVAETRPDLQALARKLELAAHVGVVSGTKMVYLAKEAGHTFMQFDTHPGKVVPFNFTALGKAVAAFLPANRLDFLVDNLEQGRGPNAAFLNREAFRTELAQVRALGYAIEDQEEVEGVACIAAPFFDATGSVVAAVGVTRIVDRVVGEFRSEVIDAVVSAAASLSLRFGADSATLQNNEA